MYLLTPDIINKLLRPVSWVFYNLREPKEYSILEHLSLHRKLFEQQGKIYI